MTEQTVIQVIAESTITDNLLTLPATQLDRTIYQEVNKKLTGIGGKWNRKQQGFVFSTNPSELIERILEGEKINLKKDFQYFPTPTPIAERLVELAEINHTHSILEPSAGQGHIVDVIQETIIEEDLDYVPNIEVFDCYELMAENRKVLEENLFINIAGEDFLQASSEYKYDRIIANPPFSKNQDIDHIKKMYEVLNENGRIVTIASTHWIHSSNKKETEFREWLEEINAEIIHLEAGSFKESGTMVETVILVINKLPYV